MRPMNAKPPITPPPSDQIARQVTQALAEDIGSGDITAQLIQSTQQAKADIRCREEAVICGTPWVNEVFHQVEPSITLNWQVQEGERVSADQTLCYLEGPARGLLTGERAALNFLQTLSGTATTTAHYVRFFEGSDTQLLDTRKTIPGLRDAQKYAVRCGGGQNHRIGLYDAFLIKENHIMAAGTIELAVQNAKALAPGKTVEVEVENFHELEAALKAKADVIMLDNFSIEDTRKAVALTQKRAKLEASGGVEAEQLAEIIATGVDYVSMGALTKHVRAIDLSMRFQFDSLDI